MPCVHTLHLNCHVLAVADVIASYAVIYLDKSPEESFQPLQGGLNPPFMPFRDASFGVAVYTITILGKSHFCQFVREIKVS